MSDNGKSPNGKSPTHRKANSINDADDNDSNWKNALAVGIPLVIAVVALVAVIVIMAMTNKSTTANISHRRRVSMLATAPPSPFATHF